MEEKEKRYALLIDSDNISAKYVKNIIDELTKYGTVTIKRIYGDWTRAETTSWKEVLLKHSIQPMQQFAYTKGKNATDSFMIIDAMDILYGNHVDGFCIVTSDSDFTRLAQRLRESGKTVVGMGETKTPEAFISACDKFTYLGNIRDEDELTQETGEASLHVRKQSEIEQAILTIITENEDNGKNETNIGEIGSRLVKMYPDFDVRNYGYSKLSTFCQDLHNIKLIKRNSSCLVTIENKNADINEAIRALVSEAGRGGIELGALGRKLKQRVPSFTVKSYGFSQFNKFIKSLDYLQIDEQEEKNHIVVKLKK
ncbi:MAG: NYN domain-containing protein [Lachnospiraceae bacterium]|nr:NYN domain-containing protein [Lachnospiraceae bacterium]